MFKRWSYALIFLAICLTTAHNLVAHNHHQVMEIECDEHNDDQDDDHDGHSFFSYGHIEDNFISRASIIDFTADHFIFAFITADIVLPEQSVKCLRAKYVSADFLLPDQEVFSSSPLRGPPAIID